MTDALRVYVACLAAYNAGKLHGEWIEVDPIDDADDIQDRIDAILARSPEPDAEEWAIHDWESPVDFGIGEHESLADLVAYAELLDEFETYALRAAASGVWSHSEGPDALRACMERYRGNFDSPGDYAEELMSETAEIPDFLAPYIDWERMERDMELGGDITVERGPDGRLHVFDNHG